MYKFSEHESSEYEPPKAEQIRSKSSHHIPPSPKTQLTDEEIKKRTIANLEARIRNKKRGISALEEKIEKQKKYLQSLRNPQSILKITKSTLKRHKHNIVHWDNERAEPKLNISSHRKVRREMVNSTKDDIKRMTQDLKNDRSTLQKSIKELNDLKDPPMMPEL